MNPRSSNRTTPHKLRDRLREATTEAILAAAEKVFAREGLHGAKMEAIAAEAGVAVGTLYNHFHDRQAIFDSLIEARRSELLDRLDQALEDHVGERFEEQLRAMVVALAHHLDAHQPFLTILMEGEASHNNRAFPVAVVKPRHTMEQIYDRFQELVHRGLESNELRRDDSETFPMILMGLLRGAMMRQLFHRKQTDPSLNQLAEPFVRFFMNGAGI